MIHKIKALYGEGRGYSKCRIAKELNISRYTVSKYLKMDEKGIQEGLDNQEREKILDSNREYIMHLLRNYPKLSAVKIKRKLEGKGFHTGASSRTFRRYVNELKKNTLVKQERYYEPVIDMVPGVQCQVDVGELRDVLTGGNPTTVHFVVFVLSYSRLMYVSVSDKPIDTFTFIRMHDEAFSFFDGVVEECVYDQTKLVAIKEEFREVWFNEEFYRYATCARFDIRVCEGYDPESKGKVEAGVKYVKQDFFYGEEFESFDDLKDEALIWVTKVANPKVHGTTKQRPKELYEEKERNKMKSYFRPSFILDDDLGESRQADRTSLISHKSNKYSVPMLYQESRVYVKEDGGRLIIRDMESREIIATHVISEEKGKIIKNTNHYRDHQKKISEREIEISHMIGETLSEKLCNILKSTSPKIYKDQLTGLIRVLKYYASKDNLYQPLSVITERQQLKVTFIRDYLDAYYSDKNRAEEKTNKSPEGTGMLKIYGSLLNPATNRSSDYE